MDRRWRDGDGNGQLEEGDADNTMEGWGQKWMRVCKKPEIEEDSHYILDTNTYRSSGNMHP